MSKKILIKTFGCQMNKYDSEVMGRCLVSEGYGLVENENEADVILVNTCSVREHAETRVAGVVNSLKSLKNRKLGLVLGICGCMAQKEGRKLVEKFPHVDLVCGTYRFMDIAGIVKKAVENGKTVVDVGEESHPHLSPPPSRGRIMEKGERKVEGRVCAFVAVMRGCDSYCSYCVVPYLRGRERSRASGEIVDEVRCLAERGIKEVCLLGQNIAAYGKSSGREPDSAGIREEKVDFVGGRAWQEKKESVRIAEEKIDLAGLLEKVNEVGEISRMRFITSHPRDVDDRLLHAVKNLDKVCESLHFPLQAGSDRILELMNRGYMRDDYRRLIEKTRALMPDAGITTDIIVGFPGETDGDFRDTIELVKEIEFDDAFMYRYSHRSGTKAALLEEQVDDKVKQERLEELMRVQRDISAKKNKKLEGREVEVLVEEVSKKDSSSVYGRTRSDKNVVFKGGEELIGKLVNVKIVRTGPATLVGEEIASPPRSVGGSQ